MKTTIYDFDFEIAGHGYYKVTYTSPATGKRWTTTTNNMPLIDATKNAEEPNVRIWKNLKGFVKMGKFVDEVGAIRHAMSDKELNELYKRLENFIADCTVEEAKESRDAFVKVQTMIYQRMRETKK